MSVYGQMSRGVVVRAVVWIIASIVFLDVAIGRVRGLHAAGLSVSGWRYAQIGFWVVVLLFWVVYGIRGWRATRERRRVV